MQKKLWVTLGAVAALSLIASMTLASPSRLDTPKKPWGVRYASPGSTAEATVAGDGAHVDTIVVMTRNERSRFIDNPPRREFNQGDEFVVTAPLFRRGNRVGNLDVAGTVTDVRREAIQFTGTATIRGSQITATGVLAEGGTVNGFDLAVTGGEGRYFGAEGELHIRFTSNNSSRLTFHLEK